MRGEGRGIFPGLEFLVWGWGSDSSLGLEVQVYSVYLCFVKLTTQERISTLRKVGVRGFSFSEFGIWVFTFRDSVVWHELALQERSSRLQGFGFKDFILGMEIEGSEIGVSDFSFWVRDFGFRVPGVGCQVSGFGSMFRVSGFGF